MRLRLLTPVEQDALRDTGLHDWIASKLVDEVVQTTVGLEKLYPTQEVSFETVRDTLVSHLRENQDIRAKVRAEAALGGTPLGEEALLRALASWIIERQLDEKLEWDPRKKPRRRGRLRRLLGID